MAVKSRNGDRNKHALGRTKFIRCYGKCLPKDKAINRFVARNIVEEAAAADVQEACAFEGYMLPNSFIGCSNPVFLVPLTQESLVCDL